MHKPNPLSPATEAVPDIKAAKATLRSYLEDLFGGKLRGVSGIGSGRDLETHAPLLAVMTTTAAAAQRAKSALPADIDGIPIRVTQRGSALFD
jgi:hypothetical protein